MIDRDLQLQSTAALNIMCFKVTVLESAYEIYSKLVRVKLSYEIKIVSRVRTTGPTTNDCEYNFSTECNIGIENKGSSTKIVVSSHNQPRSSPTIDSSPLIELIALVFP